MLRNTLCIWWISQFDAEIVRCNAKHCTALYCTATECVYCFVSYSIMCVGWSWCGVIMLHWVSLHHVASEFRHYQTRSRSIHRTAVKWRMSSASKIQSTPYPSQHIKALRSSKTLLLVSITYSHLSQIHVNHTHKFITSNIFINCHILSPPREGLKSLQCWSLTC